MPRIRPDRSNGPKRRGRHRIEFEVDAWDWEYLLRHVPAGVTVAELCRILLRYNGYLPPSSDYSGED